MGKKKKTKPRRPPLSLLDRGIYAAGCGLCCAVWLGLSFLGYFLGEVAATRDASVIAYTRGASSVLCLPWALYLCLPLFLWLRGKWESKQPIFGTWKYHYGKAPWAADCFPLFDERRRHCKRPRTQAQRKERAFWLRLWLCGFVLATALACMSVYGRVCMRADHTIAAYSAFGQEKAVYSPDAFAKLEISVYVRKYYIGSRRWAYQVVITTQEGRVVHFACSDFVCRDGEYADDLALDRMQEIKALFPPEVITIKGKKHFAEAAKERNLTSQQRAKLARLLELEEN